MLWRDGGDTFGVTTTAPDGRELVDVEGPAEWRAWLMEHHERPSGVWLALPRKQGEQEPSLTYAAAVEEALAYGWIDSKSNRLDATRSLLWMSPRKPKSGWSKVNKARIAKLEREGRMAAPGRAAVAAAKRSGTWTALDAVEALEVPVDLGRALSADERAMRHFDAFPPSARKGILTWIADAKREETRERRIAETVRLAARNERANQWRPR